ncbi:unnamed protein product [Closterium sp. NIES-65]|nr:unnamed protein product [Closterium sp. NIES-65]
MYAGLAGLEGLGGLTGSTYAGMLATGSEHGGGGGGAGGNKAQNAAAMSSPIRFPYPPPPFLSPITSPYRVPPFHPPAPSLPNSPLSSHALPHFLSPIPSVPPRAMQAAKLRASKTALERHDVEIIGSGPELLVFSHGFGYNKNVWSGVIKALDKTRYKIVLYNVTGALGTDYDAFDYQRYSTLHGFTDDLLLLLHELGVEGWERGQQCTVVGQQQAGMVALLASLERPTLFKRIVLLSSSPRLLGAEGYEGSYALEDLDQVFGIMQGNFKLWVRNCAPVLTADDIKAGHVREFVRPLFLLRPDIAFSFLKTAFACDVRDILPRVSAYAAREEDEWMVRHSNRLCFALSRATRHPQNRFRL